MFGTTDRTLTASILTTFNALGIKPPKNIATAYAEAETLAEANLGTDRGTLEAALVAAILAGRDVHTDPEVQAAIAASYLSSNVALSTTLAAAGIERIREACLTQVDNIVSTWAEEFHKAAVTLTAAHVRIGNVPLNDAPTILARGGDIADVWAEAKAADMVAEQILAGWTSLMQFVRVPLNAEQRAIRLTALTWQQFRATSPKLTAWDAVCAGLTVSLPTLEEYRSRLARLESSRTAAQAAAMPVDVEREANKSWGANVERARAITPA